MGSILGLHRVSSWTTEEDGAPRPISLNLSSLYRCLKAVFHSITPRKTAGPLLPLQNPTPKPSDHPPLKQSLLISNSDADSECPNINFFSDHCLEENHEYSSETVNTKDSATIYIPRFGSHLLDSYSTSSIPGTDSAVFTQENAPRKNISYAEHKEPGICISTEKKSQKSSQEKEREMKKAIQKQSTVVVEKTRWIKHYSSSHRILLVGEGDFSFSYSLAAAFGCASKMIATSLDSKEFLKKNYAKAPWNIGELKKRGCIVMHGVDATTIATQQLLQHKTFDRIIYNFPFAGFFKGLSRDSSLRRHRRVVSLFLKNAKEMIDEHGEIHISHKTNEYHSEWNLVSIASSHGLRLIEEVEFDLNDYPGYNTKRGFGGDENFNCYPSNTFKFGLKSSVVRGYACKRGIQGHNEKTCTSNITPPNPIVNKEKVASQDEPISQLTQELECQRARNLHGSDEVHVQPVEQTVATSALSMYQLFQECQNLIQSNEKCTTKSSTSKSIIKGGGKKFVSPPNLSSTIAEVKHATCKGKGQGKGKKTEEYI